MIGLNVTLSNVGEIRSQRNAVFALDVDDNIIPVEIINENGGRAILPRPGMTAADAHIWAKFRGDAELMEAFSKITYQSSKDLSSKATVIGDNAVILNTKTVRNSLIGPSAIIDGAEIISNSSIMSCAEEMTLIGHAVQIRNSVIGYGNNIDSAAQLKSVMTGECVEISQSARISHSVIGDCSHISCCEIANSLVGPFHSQHHNNSFLIAAYVGGQSNIAAGATIGSNHNSRANDGEIWAKRGFWPGLCVSLKHNSRFASFTMIAKGSYPAELDVKLPFSLITIDNKTSETVIFPAYWFTRNMYATMRNADKFIRRDTRVFRRQHIEHDILAPDTIEEIFEALRLIESGEPLNMERGHPETTIKNADNACNAYRMMIRHYIAKNILHYMRDNDLKSVDDLQKSVGPLSDDNEVWLNCGLTVINKTALSKIIEEIKQGGSVDEPSSEKKEINSWNDIRALFDTYASSYPKTKIRHALQSLARLEFISVKALSDNILRTFLEVTREDCKTIAALTRSSRAKDYADPFRAMVYESKEEMEAVLGRMDDDPVIKQVDEDMAELSALADSLLPCPSSTIIRPTSK
jgi:hypothetical protein